MKKISSIKKTETRVWPPPPQIGQTEPQARHTESIWLIRFIFSVVFTVVCVSLKVWLKYQSAPSSNRQPWDKHLWSNFGSAGSFLMMLGVFLLMGSALSLFFVKRS